MPDPQDDLRFIDPPPGFVVLRESELDPEQGRADRWVVRGIINGRSVIRSDLRARSSACRAAWFAYDDARAVTGEPPDVTDVAQVDAAIAEALARKHARRREESVDEPSMKTDFTVRLDSWAHIEATLLARRMEPASARIAASKMIDVPRSTLSRWVQEHRANGTWPT